MNIEKLFYLFSIAVALMSASAWLASIDNKASAAQTQSSEAAKRLDKDETQFGEIRERLIRIEDKLDH